LFGCQLGSDQPAERVADHIDALEADRLEPAAKPGCQLRGRDVPTKSRQVDEVDAAAPLQSLRDS
jgi:hypothetical protein